jgi:hypothetical protein
MALTAVKVQPVRRVTLELQELMVLSAHRDQQVLRVIREFPVLMVHQVFKGLRAIQVLQVLRLESPTCTCLTQRVETSDRPSFAGRTASSR